MNNGSEQLRVIGAQKIHETTHIAKKHLNAIFEGDFSNLNKIQLLGFISILEREYNLNLDELRAECLEYFSGEPASLKQDDDEVQVFVTSEKDRNFKPLYIAIAIAILLGAIFFSDSLTSTKSTNTYQIDNSAIDDAKNNLNNNQSEEVTDINETIEPEVVKTFKIMSDTELWIGYIDLSSREKYQKLFTGELELDPNKDWLLHLGHGYVDIDVNGEIQEFRGKLNMRMAYQNGEIRKIRFSEFKRLNNGEKW